MFCYSTSCFDLLTRSLAREFTSRQTENIHKQKKNAGKRVNKSKHAHKVSKKGQKGYWKIKNKNKNMKFLACTYILRRHTMVRGWNLETLAKTNEYNSVLGMSFQGKINQFVYNLKWYNLFNIFLFSFNIIIIIELNLNILIFFLVCEIFAEISRFPVSP